jgi:hypothetical protein
MSVILAAVLTMQLLLAAGADQQAASGPSAKSRADWVALRDANFAVPSGQTPMGLLREMNVLLGSTDPFLRDNVAYEAAARWIYTNGLLSAPEQREILGLWTANLEAGLGEPAADAAFRRSFSALNLSIMAARDNAAAFLSQEEFDRFLAAVLDYLDRERDTRGYDPAKGWIHAAAHTADVLKFMARSPKLPLSAQGALLAAIDRKCTTFGGVFQWGEDERLAQVIVSLAKRPDFDKPAFGTWLESIRTRRSALWAHAPAIEPADFPKVQNLKLVLRAAYVALAADPAAATTEPARTALLDTLRILR